MNKDKTLFEFTDYRDYLREKLQRIKIRGVQSKLASAIQCQPTYVTLVLQEKAHLSLEQSMKVSEFLGHNNLESDFFLMLVQKSRAGTKQLEAFFDQKLNELKIQSGKISKRIKTQKSLTAEQQSLYYSSWTFAAIHMAVTIPELQDRFKIAKHLDIPIKSVNKVVDALLDMNLIAEVDDRLKPSEREIWIGSESYNVNKHRSNWRNKAIASLDFEQEKDLHYSAVVSLSREDVIKIREVLMSAIKQNVDIIKDSKEQELYCINLDFFDLHQSK